MRNSISVLMAIALLLAGVASGAWISSSTPVSSSRFTTFSLQAKSSTVRDGDEISASRVPIVQKNPKRRDVLLSSAAAALMLGGASVSVPADAAHADVVRAVGGAEIECREKGNCLEMGEIDGALNWSWGAKDRCDPSDPLCGNDGKLREKVTGQPVPSLPGVAQITHVAAIQVEIGRGELGVLKLGFYGQDAPASVQQMMDFLSPNGGGLVAEPKQKPDILGMNSIPVALERGGIVDLIAPGLTVDFGVPSQANAYARSKGMSKAGDYFMAQGRPDPAATAQDQAARLHTTAGLVSMPRKGLGYGGSGFESEDEAYESSFLITAAAVPALDKSRLVVGQVLDAPSMALLERLASLPTKKGIRGVIPGQTSGPPLLRVIVRETETSKVSGGGSSSSTSS